MGRKNLILIAIIIVLLLIIVSGIILYIFVLNKPNEPVVKELEIDKNVVPFEFGIFYNNIKDSKKFSKLIVKLDIDKKLVEIMNDRTTEIRDAINYILRGKTEQDFVGSEAQLRSKQEILNKIKEILRTEKKIVVYIDEMIVQ